MKEGSSAFYRSECAVTRRWAREDAGRRQRWGLKYREAGVVDFLRLDGRIVGVRTGKMLQSMQ